MRGSRTRPVAVGSEIELAVDHVITDALPPTTLPTAEGKHRNEAAEIDVAAVAATESTWRCTFEAPAVTGDTARGVLARINTIVVRYEQCGDQGSHPWSHAWRPEIDGGTGRDGAHRSAVCRLIIPNAHVGSNQYREDRCVVGSVANRAACLHWTRECQIRHEHNGTLDDPHDRAWSPWLSPPGAQTRTVLGGYDSSIPRVGREPGR